LLPQSMRAKPGFGTVVALGDGQLEGGQAHDFQVKVGDSLLFTTYTVGRVKLKMESSGEEVMLMREGDVIGVLPSVDPDYSDIPKLQPLFNSVLLRMAEPPPREGSLFVMGAERALPKCGTIEAIAPGRIKDGKRVPVANVKEGDFVMLIGGGTEISTGADTWNVADGSYICGAMPFASEREIVDLDPYDDWMVAKLEEPPDTTKSGLFLNQKLAGQVTLAVIQKAGPGITNVDTGELKPNEFKVGDRVMYRPENIKLFEGKAPETKYILLRQKDVVCKVSE